MAQTAVAAAEDSAFEAAAIATIITTIASPSYLSPAAAAATEAPCARHRRHATVSSASLRSPWGRAPSGAWVHAGSMPPAHVLCRLRAMDAHKQQHGSGSRRRTLTPMIESVAARGGRENYSFDCGGDCLSHHVVLMEMDGFNGSRCCNSAYIHRNSPRVVCRAAVVFTYVLTYVLTY